MLKERSFNLIIVGTDHGTGVATTGNPDKVILYQGEGQIVQL
jgi:hypothetical protein